MKIKLIFAWYDFWVGLFWDKAKRCLYIFPVPCVGIRIHLQPLHRACPDCGHMTTWQDGGHFGNRYECWDCNWAGPWVAAQGEQCEAAGVTFTLPDFDAEGEQPK